MPGKLGVYVCTGCAIGETIDAAKLAKVATGECHAAVCRTHVALCGSAGCAQIRQDLAGGTVDTVVVAACSPRFKAESFSFNHGSVVERVNLREHVAWCHKPQDEDTQMLAEDYLRMGVARALKTEPLKPLADEISKTVLVVGGGVSGISAATEAAQAGYSVVLVEREKNLGGYAALVKKHVPSEPPYIAATANEIQASIEALSYQSRIRVFRSAQITGIDGQPGMFDVTLETESERHVIRAGAIVVATGWKPYDVSHLVHLGYGIAPNVVTSVEFEQMATKGPIVRPFDGRPVKRVLFIQCAGSRDKDHLPYCSTACCMTTLVQTTYIHEQDPEAEVYVVYKDIRTPGQYERFYRAVQDQPLNFFTKGEVASVEKRAGRTPGGHGKSHPAGRIHRLKGRLGGIGHRHGPQRQRPDSETDLPPGSGTAGACRMASRIRTSCAFRTRPAAPEFMPPEPRARPWIWLRLARTPRAPP